MHCDMLKIQDGVAIVEKLSWVGGNRGAGRSIIGGANIHLFVFCTINFFWNHNLNIKVNCFYSLWTRIYEYWPPQLSIFRRPSEATSLLFETFVFTTFGPYTQGVGEQHPRENDKLEIFCYFISSYTWQNYCSYFISLIAFLVINVCNFVSDMIHK